MAEFLQILIGNFARFDPEGTGTIERQHLLNALRALPGLSSEQIDDALRAYTACSHVGKDEHVNYIAFLGWIFGIDNLAQDKGLQKVVQAPHQKIKCLPRKRLDDLEKALRLLDELGFAHISDVKALYAIVGARLASPDLVQALDQSHSGVKDWPQASCNLTVNYNNEIRCATHFSSVLGDTALTEGSWVYEATVLDAGASGDSISAILGWADSELFSGSSMLAPRIGDTSQSWGIVVYRDHDVTDDAINLASKRHNGESQDFGLPIKANSVISCAITLSTDGAATISFGLDGMWDAPMGQAFADTLASSGRIKPALCLGASTRIRMNFGDRPFVHPVPKGFLPVYSYVPKPQVPQPPSWLQVAMCAPKLPQSSLVAIKPSRVYQTLLQQISINLQLLQIELARSVQRDPAVDATVHDMKVRISALLK